MESFAFWYSKNPDKGPQELEATLNFNLWYECGWKSVNTDPVLDIGFKVSYLSHATKLYFFVPFCIAQEEKNSTISDLGCKFNKTELVDALFNESYKTTISANSKVIVVQNLSSAKKPSKDWFYIYQLDIDHDIELEQFANGTIIKIGTENLLSSPNIDKENGPDTYYLRFRIHHKDLTCMTHQYTPPHSPLFGPFDSTYMIDFRYHNVRSLDKTLIEEFYRPGNSIVRVKSLHFLLMTKAYIDVQSQHIANVRKLETDVWCDYIDRTNPCELEDILAYHHALKPKSSSSDPEEISFLSSAEVFLKIKKSRSKLLPYIACTVFLAWISSIVGEKVLFPLLCSIIRGIVGQ